MTTIDQEYILSRVVAKSAANISIFFIFTTMIEGKSNTEDTFNLLIIFTEREIASLIS